MSESVTKEITRRQRAAIRILFFIVRVLNPTEYRHQVDALQKEVDAELGET